MKLYEKDLEDLIWGRIKSGRISTLKDKGLGCISNRPNNIYYRQLNLGDYGIADLVQVNQSENGHYAEIEILELKGVEYKGEFLDQLSRYIEGAFRLFRGRYRTINVFGTLICRDYKEEYPHLQGLLTKISFLKFEFCLDSGFVFKPFNNLYHPDNYKPPQKIKAKEIFKSRTQMSISKTDKGV